jgi:hypothetical protein
MSSDQQQNVETVIIEEPSDRVQVLPDERSCMTRKHLYVLVGVLLIAAIALIGTLLSFSPSSNNDQLTVQQMTEGVQYTFAQFDTNSDGYVDYHEMNNWITSQLAQRKSWMSDVQHETTPTIITDDSSNNGTQATSDVVQSNIDNCDYNHDGKIHAPEWVQCTVEWQMRHPNSHREHNQAIVPSFETEAECPFPKSKAFRGHGDHGRDVGACQLYTVLGCFPTISCQHPKKCPMVAVDVQFIVQGSCCGEANAANCTQACTCSHTYKYVPHGNHPALLASCSAFSTYWCDDQNTGAPVA